MRTQSICLALVIVLICPFASAQPLQTIGSSGRRLTHQQEWEQLNTATSLDSFFTSIMSTNHIPGLAACIVKKDSTLWQGYYGYADISKSKPVTDSTIFILASLSKTIMVTALMQLHEEGKFKLDDSVNAYLPFSVRNPQYPGIPITFRMLLTHTSSIQDNWNVLHSVVVTGDSPMSLDTFLQQYLTPGGQYYNSTQNFYSYAPGTTGNYCNIGTTLAGYLVEVISGVPFDKYCQDSVFAPLQMSNTAWFLRGLDTTLIARPYTYSFGTYTDNGLYGFPHYPCGQLRTTAASLAKFLMANINGGELKGSRILDSATVRMIRTVYLPSILGGAWQLGLIWLKEKYTGHGLWGHDGSVYGAATAMYLSEVDSTGVIFQMNTDWTLSLERDIVNRLIDEAYTLTVGVRDAIADIPERFQLLQNYPNPFNPSTTIRYGLPSRSHVTLSVFNTLGQKVRTLVDEVVEAGYQSVEFDASDLASGVYLCRLHAGDYVATKRLVLLR